MPTLKVFIHFHSWMWPITADELMNMPEEAIHSFKIKFSPRNYSVSQTDDDSLLEDFVMR